MKHRANWKWGKVLMSHIHSLHQWHISSSKVTTPEPPKQCHYLGIKCSTAWANKGQSYSSCHSSLGRKKACLRGTMLRGTGWGCGWNDGIFWSGSVWLWWERHALAGVFTVLGCFMVDIKKKSFPMGSQLAPEGWSSVSCSLGTQQRGTCRLSSSRKTLPKPLHVCCEAELEYVTGG